MADADVGADPADVEVDLADDRLADDRLAHDGPTDDRPMTAR